MLTHADHIINFELIRAARSRTKQAFIPGTDPGMAGGGGAPPPGGDPSGGGGAPPGAPPPDPAAGGGGAPPPPDPSGGGGGGGALDAIMNKLNQMGMMSGGQPGAGAGAGGAIKPKIDQNVVMLQILKLLARICDQLGIHVPAEEMVPGQQDLQQLAATTQGGGQMPGDASGGGAAPGGIQPVQPMPPMGGGPKTAMDGYEANFRNNGSTFDTKGLSATRDKAAAAMAIIRFNRLTRQAA